MAGLEGIGKLLLLLARRLPFVGKLPGDSFVQKGHFSFYFPLVTILLMSIVVSIVLSVVFRLLR